MNSLFSVEYDSKIFSNCTECSICLEEFAEVNENNNHSETKITPLPCSQKHVFHTKCIK
jgi:hypothetical protein